MVFSRNHLSKAFSPNKIKRKQLLGGTNHNPSASGSTLSTVKSESASQANVKVIVRVRPESERESQSNHRKVVKIIDDKMLIFDPKAEENPFYFQGVAQKGRDLLKKQNKEIQFMFDRIFDCSASNLDVFEESTKNMISTLLDGYNCSVFVYGATGAGKTHTMLGGQGDPGITYLTMAELFSQIELQNAQKNFDLGVSYLEVYNENVQDLLNKSGPLHVREDGRCGIMVTGLKIMSINNAEELLNLLAKGNKNRTQHPTDANAESSRSHAVFQVHINITNKLDGQVKHVKLSMIDLAGSERASATGCRGARFKEGANINKSLLALGNCINNLADNLKHIPYRDSKLTRLLKDSLGGNCQTVMIANVSPSNLSYEDTYNTLRYANRAKKIQTNVKKNIVSCQMHITGYIKIVEEQKKEIDVLKQRILALEGGLPKSGETAAAGPEVDLSKWLGKLSTLYDEKKSLIVKILSLESTDKTLCCRILKKKEAHSRLHILTLDADAVIPDDVNTSGKRRIKKSMCFFKRQRESIKIQMDALWNELREIEQELQNLSLSIDSNDLTSKLADKITIYKSEIEKCTFKHQIEHMQKICNIQESENSSTKNIVELVSKTLVRFFNLMHGYGTITDPMKDEFKRLIRSLEGMKGVKWFDTEMTEEEEEFSALSCLSIEQISNPLEHELPPPLPTVLSEEDDPANTSRLNGTFDALPVKQEQIMGTNETIVVAHKNDSYSESSDELSDNTGEKGTIDTSKLNNTFSLVESKAKKRVLMDKNEVIGKPTLNKVKKVTPDLKPTLKSRNNNPFGKENKTVANSRSVMSARSVAILNKIKADRAKNFPPNMSQSCTERAQPILVTIRGKEKRVLATNVHPYNRPVVNKSKFNVQPSSRVPW
ncbi:kinesin-like protein KIF18A [Athalia rosae]|uniref:kinesin-like protein KIF18A n=1 Tax=Athalia rosae TaxID=37344 RepID=UPI00203455D3|nr:kinesin-like protein KIF18A [Athalia rosae]